MCKAVEDFGSRIAEEEQKKTISALLKKGMSVEWIHDTLDFPVELIEKVQKTIA